MNLQYQLSNGKWFDLDEARATRFLEMAASHKGSAIADIESKLASGENVQYDSDWYASIRDKDIFEQRVQAARERRQADPKVYQNGRRLDCGHYVYHQDHVMNGNFGTSCTDCYGILG